MMKYVFSVGIFLGQALCLAIVFMSLDSCGTARHPHKIMADQPGARAGYRVAEQGSKSARVTPVSYENSDDRYGGWDFIAQKLRQDGIPESLLKSAYGGTTLPRFDFVPFKLAPKETHELYQGYRTAQIKMLMQQCYQRYQPEFDAASRQYKISPRIMLAIVVVESHCGQLTGSELILNRLSRVASTSDPRNIQRNFKELIAANTDDSEITYIGVQPIRCMGSMEIKTEKSRCLSPPMLFFQ